MGRLPLEWWVCLVFFWVPRFGGWCKKGTNRETHHFGGTLIKETCWRLSGGQDWLLEHTHGATNKHGFVQKNACLKRVGLCTFMLAGATLHHFELICTYLHAYLITYVLPYTNPSLGRVLPWRASSLMSTLWPLDNYLSNMQIRKSAADSSWKTATSYQLRRSSLQHPRLLSSLTCGLSIAPCSFW